ncbi:MAG: glycosyltransferase family 4 protein [Candidatus Cloacimonadaceae bacterium]|nr:glycosyltransferase family 4 protein [Candidatus Cloacimonadaceae bacterium]
MKKLLIITDMYPHERNPIAGIFVRQQVVELSKLYDTMVLATHFPAKPSCRKTSEDNHALWYVHYPMSKRFFPITVYHYRKYVISRLKDILKNWQPEIIHVHDCRHIPELFALAPVLKNYTGKKFLSIHNIKTLPERAEHPILSLFYNATLKAAFQNWDHVFFVNQKLRQRIEHIVPLIRSSNLGNAISPFKPIPNPYTDELISWLKADHYKIISAGNLVKTKGFDLLIQAVKTLNADGEKLQLVIVGEGEERERLTHLCISLQMQDLIRIDGARENALLRSSYPLFDAFVLPSYSESFGIVYLEALYAGIPVVGVKGQGIHGIFQNSVHALFCEPNDVSDLIQKIKQMMRNPQLMKSMTDLGKQLVCKEYMMEHLIRRITNIYEIS